MQTHILTNMRAHTRTHMHSNIHAHVYAHKHACTPKHTCLHVHVYKHTRKHIYTHFTRMHMDTSTLNSQTYMLMCTRKHMCVSSVHEDSCSYGGVVALWIGTRSFSTKGRGLESVAGLNLGKPYLNQSPIA